MNIYVEDQYPGRCLNHRPGPNGTQLRCLDYEGVQHVCTFPAGHPGVAVAADVHRYAVTLTDNTRPLPWVKPGVQQ